MIFASLIIIASGILCANFASAKELDDEGRNHISQNCAAAQSNLQRLGSSDTTTRINRGRDYDQALKLFFTMNTRVASNNITEPKLAEITKEFENELSFFRDNYNSYNEQLRNTIDFGCVSEPQEFYELLEASRSRRTILNANVTKLNKLIEDYQQAIKDLTV